MKNFLITVIALLILASCNDNEENNQVIPPPSPDSPDTIVKINPESILSIRIDDKITKSISEHYTPRFITLHAWDYLRSDVIQNVPGREYYWRNRDTVENKITFMGWDVICPIGDSTYMLGYLINAENILLRIALDSNQNVLNPLNAKVYSVVDYDTVSYIPNAIMRKNQKILDSLFNAKDYQSCYQMFDTAYRFIPITGAAWRKLKEEGIE